MNPFLSYCHVRWERLTWPRINDHNGYENNKACPKPAYLSNSCWWTFTVPAGVAMDLVCNPVEVSCANQNYLWFRLNSNGWSPVCGDGSRRRVTSSLVAQRSSYTLNVVFEARSNRAGRAVCSIRGSGGGGSPPPPPPPIGGDVECGQTRNTNRVIGGTNAQENEFPWMVYIGGGYARNAPKKGGEYLWLFAGCGGSLITPQFVLTA